jgi:hypothetical protein
LKNTKNNLKKQQLDDPRIKARIAAFEKKQSDRAAMLDSDPQFLIETERVKKYLEQAYGYDPQSITAFFERYPLVNIFNYRAAKNFLNSVRGVDTRAALNRYLAYAGRFRVLLRFRKGSTPHFKPESLIPYGRRFKATIVDGHLETEGAIPADFPIYDYMETEKLSVSMEAEELIDSGEVIFVQLRDSSGFSVLNELENLAYDESALTFIQHEAEQPYLFCLFGERVNKEKLARAGKVISAFQKEFYHRAKGGRPMNTAKFKEAAELDEKPGPSKVKAAALAKGDTAKDLKREEDYLFNFRKKTKPR